MAFFTLLSFFLILLVVRLPLLWRLMLVVSGAFTHNIIAWLGFSVALKVGWLEPDESILAGFWLLPLIVLGMWVLGLGLRPYSRQHPGPRLPNGFVGWKSIIPSMVQRVTQLNLGVKIACLLSLGVLSMWVVVNLFYPRDFKFEVQGKIDLSAVSLHQHLSEHEWWLGWYFANIPLDIHGRSSVYGGQDFSVKAYSRNKDWWEYERSHALSVQPKTSAVDYELVSPLCSPCVGNLQWQAVGDDSSAVTWTVEGKAPLSLMVIYDQWFGVPYFELEVAEKLAIFNEYLDSPHDHVLRYSAP